MAQLRQDYQKFVDRNTEVITIGPEDTKNLHFGGMVMKCRLLEYLTPNMILLSFIASNSNFLKAVDYQL